MEDIKTEYEIRYICPKCNTKLSKSNITEITVGNNFKEKFGYLEGKYCTGCWIEISFKDLPKLIDV